MEEDKRTKEPMLHLWDEILRDCAFVWKNEIDLCNVIRKSVQDEENKGGREQGAQHFHT